VVAAAVVVTGAVVVAAAVVVVAAAVVVAEAEDIIWYIIYDYCKITKKNNAINIIIY